MFEAASWFCADMKTKQRPYWLSFLGNSGTGKTHLARAIVEYFKRTPLWNEAYVKSTNVVSHRDYRWRSWPRIVADLQDGQFHCLEDVETEWLVVIDDIGADHDPRKFGVSKLLELMEERAGRWTIFTSNLHMPQIATDLDTRIASRLIRDRSIVIDVTTRDFNLRPHPHVLNIK